MTAAVRAQSLRLDYGTRAVFDRVDIALYPGTFTAVVGPNGAGKSSLLRLLAGVQLPTAGTIERTARVMLIASDSAPPPDVTPRDLAGYGLALRRPWYRFAAGPEEESAIYSGLVRAGLADRADDPIGSLSAGEVQRAWIAAALATKPAALLVDEPTSHLDLRFQLEVLRTLRNLAASGVAVAVAMHDLTLAARFADCAAMFADGTLLVGPPEEIFVPGALARAFGIAVTTHRHPVDGYLVCLPSEIHRSPSNMKKRLILVTAALRVAAVAPTRKEATPRPRRRRRRPHRRRRRRRPRSSGSIPQIVTAQRHAGTIGSTSRVTWVLTTADLLRLGAASVADALRFVPGVTVKDTGTTGSLQTVALRGTKSEQTLVLVDGRPINDPDTGAVDFSSIP